MQTQILRPKIGKIIHFEASFIIVLCNPIVQCVAWNEFQMLKRPPYTYLSCCRIVTTNPASFRSYPSLLKSQNS